MSEGEVIAHHINLQNAMIAALLFNLLPRFIQESTTYFAIHILLVAKQHSPTTCTNTTANELLILVMVSAMSLVA